MKIILLIILILFFILMINIRIKIYKVNTDSLKVSLILFKIFPIKFKLIKVNNLISKSITNISLKTDKKKIKMFFNHQKLIKKLINLFTANTCFFSINTKYYLDNLNLYLSTFYLYSFIQNLLYTNLSKLKKSCFKSRIKKVDVKLEIDLDLETKVYKLIYFLVKNNQELIKIFKELKNERSSNMRIIENING